MEQQLARPRGAAGTHRAALLVGAIGVVFGDIGTSPLYALRESFSEANGIPASPENVLGIVSLLFWTLSLIVCVKYLGIVLRADNKGEGGVLALVSLVSRYISQSKPKALAFAAGLGILGTALLFADGMLTPSVSVLSAVEGLTVLDPGLGRIVVPATLVILVALFLFQKRGTEKLGLVFGPILALWFLVSGGLGLASIIAMPRILLALDPSRAISFLARHGVSSLSTMGSVFLAMTGAEVLYSDLGHFGASPIRRSWFALVYPGLLLSYFGQGAFLLAHPGQTDNLFYRLAPPWAIIPLVILATVATVIASQAVITGAFSIARQSVQLGLWPRVRIRHTSAKTIGQVYVPIVNWFLMIGTIGLVLAFRSSARLSHAYGITVSATMLITTLLMLYLARKAQKLSYWILAPFGALFLLIDGSFFAANATKALSGGWIVILMAALIFLMMKTWVDGRNAFREKIQGFRLDPEDFVKMIAQSSPTRVDGTAFFLTADPVGVPKALLHNLKHNRVLHKRTVILSVQTLDEPYVERERRMTVVSYGKGFYHVILHFGFSETPDLPWALEDLSIRGFDHNPLKTTYFLGREAILLKSGSSGLAGWRKYIFRFMFNNAASPTDFFRLPAELVIELGSKTEL
jgi:KUP system potassium uptake protein